MSDNGAQFVSKAFERFCQTHGIQHVRSTPYSLQSNGVVERMHKTLKAMIAKNVEAKGNWAEVVPMSCTSSPMSRRGISRSS